MKFNKKIIAKGGGQIAKSETLKIDKEMIKLTGKKKPKFLFIPTASLDSKRYCDLVKKYFGKKLGCKVSILYLIKKQPKKKEIKERILNSAIIYVGGGNVIKMMRIWRKFGVDKILKQAHNKGIVLSGLSAGSICWFKYGNSDSKKFSNKNADYNHIRVSGLRLINALYCPHYDIEKKRKLSLKKMMKKMSGVAIAIDNCCAIEIIDDKYRILSSKSKANAYKVFWKGKKFFEEKINKNNKFFPLVDLLKK